MRRLLLLPVLLFLSASVLAQLSVKTDTYSLAWNRGMVVFPAGDTVHCNLRYNQAISNGILQVKEGDRIIALTAKDVATFCFYDSTREKERKFSAMPVSTAENADQKFFLEYIYDDERFSILNHRTIGLPYEYMNYSRFVSKPARISRKYILNMRTGEIMPLSKENTLRLMQSRKEEIMSFIEANRIRFKKTADYICVFRYHSSL
jgi:hypothetical protein